MVRLGEKVSCATRVLVVLVVEPGLVARELVPAPRLVDRLRRQARHRAAVQAASRTARLLRGAHVVGAGRQKGWRPSASRPARAEEASACTIIGRTMIASLSDRYGVTPMRIVLLFSVRRIRRLASAQKTSGPTRSGSGTAVSVRRRARGTSSARRKRSRSILYEDSSRYKRVEEGEEGEPQMCMSK